MERNARFTHWLDADNTVRITLRPGQTLSWGKGWRHEEGWSSVSYTWTHTGDGILEAFASDGTDCDGRLSRYSETFCPLDRLASHAWEWNGSMQYTPAWEPVESSQRDYQAEAAGY